MLIELHDLRLGFCLVSFIVVLDFLVCLFFCIIFDRRGLGIYENRLLRATAGSDWHTSSFLRLTDWAAEESFDVLWLRRL
jgi:hypothetical protein